MNQVGIKVVWQQSDWIVRLYLLLMLGAVIPPLAFLVAGLANWRFGIEKDVFNRAHLRRQQRIVMLGFALMVVGVALASTILGWFVLAVGAAWIAGAAYDGMKKFRAEIFPG
ncbi:hypothetical protein ACYPKM_05610 [Pseudomonas aeruginosa]